MNAPTAIRHWNRIDRYIDTTIKKMIRPSIALTEISWPQLELTDCTLITLGEMFRSEATFGVTVACSAGVTSFVLTTICRLSPEPTTRAASATWRPARANADSASLAVI